MKPSVLNTHESVCDNDKFNIDSLQKVSKKSICLAKLTLKST